MRAAIVLDRASSVPLHRQIYDQWRQGILTGRFRRAERVPSTRELCTSLQVSRSTVTQAYDQLVAEGYLEPSQGSGTFVCGELPDQLLLPNHKYVSRSDDTPAIRLSRYGAGLNEDFSYTPSPPGFIRLTQWRPDLSLFPLAIWRKLVMRRLRSAAPELFDYADQSAGFGALRNEIAAYVARSRAVRCATALGRGAGLGIRPGAGARAVRAARARRVRFATIWRVGERIVTLRRAALVTRCCVTQSVRHGRRGAPRTRRRCWRLRLLATGRRRRSATMG